MKKYLFGVAVIILCIACAVWITKGCAREVPTDAITPTTDERQPIVHPDQRAPVLNISNTIVVSNGVIVVDMREKIRFEDPCYNDYLQELRKAAEKGADSRFTLHVVNQDGKEVADAEVDVLFPFNGRRGNTITGKTDTHGLFLVEDRTTGESSFTISKKGYYRTSSKFSVFKIGTRCLQNGRWIPWDPMIHVTLKEIRKPIPMIAKRVETKFPKDAKSMGFDFLVGDWVAPHGKGVTADLLYIYEEDRTDKNNVNLKLTLAFPGSGNGCYMKKKEEFSAFISDHEARLDSYSSNIVSRVYKQNGTYVYEDQITEKDYLVYRVRSSCDEKGNVVSAHYGKIYGPLEAPRDLARIIRVISYFNPTPNDRNLEFDGKNNLLEGQSSRERRVYTP
jgi:hypothetical protein